MLTACLSCDLGDLLLANDMKGLHVSTEMAERLSDVFKGVTHSFFVTSLIFNLQGRESFTYVFFFLRLGVSWCHLSPLSKGERVGFARISRLELTEPRRPLSCLWPGPSIRRQAVVFSEYRFEGEACTNESALLWGRIYWGTGGFGRSCISMGRANKQSLNLIIDS